LQGRSIFPKRINLLKFVPMNRGWPFQQAINVLSLADFWPLSSSPSAVFSYHFWRQFFGFGGRSEFAFPPSDTRSARPRTNCCVFPWPPFLFSLSSETLQLCLGWTPALFDLFQARLSRQRLLPPPHPRSNPATASPLLRGHSDLLFFFLLYRAGRPLPVLRYAPPLDSISSGNFALGPSFAGMKG